MMDEADHDLALVERAVAGDRAGFAALVTRYYDLIFRVAWKWCGNREDAEDIAQDVCARLGRTIRSYSGQAAFSTWLYRVVLNTARDHNRKQVSNRRKLDAWAAEPTRPDVHVDEASAEETAAEELWQAVRQLPERQRDAVLLVYGEGLSHTEVAVAMDCAEGTVASNIHDAKKRLKVLLAQAV